MSDDAQHRPVRVCLTRCPLAAPEESMHLLPCHIQHNGAAAIKSYFRPEEASGDDEVKEGRKWRAEFRGVQLHGQQVSLQELGMKACIFNTVGLVLEDGGMTHPDDEGRVWEVDSHFDKVLFWEVPNGGDEDADVPTTLKHWTALAHAVRTGLSTDTMHESFDSKRKFFHGLLLSAEARLNASPTEMANLVCVLVYAANRSTMIL